MMSLSACINVLLWH